MIGLSNPPTIDAWGEHVGIDAVGDDADFLRRDAPAEQVIAVGRRVDEDVSGAGIQKALEPPGQTDQHRGLDHAQRDGELGPQIADLEQERPPPQDGHQPAGDRLENRGRGAHHDIDLPGPPRRTECRAHEAKERDDSPKETFVQRRIRVGAQDPNPVQILPGHQPRLVRQTLAGVIDQIAGHNRDFVAALDEMPAEFIVPRAARFVRR